VGGKDDFSEARGGMVDGSCYGAADFQTGQALSLPGL
jgi:hypothetical protein